MVDLFLYRVSNQVSNVKMVKGRDWVRKIDSKEKKRVISNHLEPFHWETEKTSMPKELLNGAA